MEIIPVDPVYLWNLVECEQKVILSALTFILSEHVLWACSFLLLDKILGRSHSFLYNLQVLTSALTFQVLKSPVSSKIYFFLSFKISLRSSPLFTPNPTMSAVGFHLRPEDCSGSWEVEISLLPFSSYAHPSPVAIAVPSGLSLRRRTREG